MSDGVQALREAFPWPPLPPNVPPRLHGWFSDRHRRWLSRYLGPETQTIVELGSWLGKSTCWFHDAAPHAVVLAVDHWGGSSEHRRHPEWRAWLPTLYETFLVNCWDRRERIVPIRLSTLDGLQLIADCGVRPDLVYVDAAHDEESVFLDTVTAGKLFPATRLTGDDWRHGDVQRGVLRAGERLNRSVIHQDGCWSLESQ